MWSDVMMLSFIKNVADTAAAKHQARIVVAGDRVARSGGYLVPPGGVQPAVLQFGSLWVQVASLEGCRMVVQHALQHGNRFGGLDIESAYLQGHWSGVPHCLRFPPVLVATLGVGAADGSGNGCAWLELVDCRFWLFLRFVPKASSIEGCRRTSSVAARQTCLADKPCSGSGGSGDCGFVGVLTAALVDSSGTTAAARRRSRPS